MKVGEALEAWIRYRERLVELFLVERSTWNNQTKIARSVAGEIGEHDVADLRKSHVEIWMGKRLRTCAPVTVNAELNVIRQFLNWCLDEQILAQKPRLPTVSVPATEENLPSDEAFAWVIANLPAHHSRALEFMMLAGLSPHELERLQGQDRILAGIAIGHRPDFKVKQASRRRIVPLNDRSAQLWDDAAQGIADDESPFPTVGAMEKAIERLRDEDQPLLFPAPAGVERITPKLMRSWFSSKVASQHPEHVLQRLLGHAPGSKVTRKHYIRSSEQQIGEAVFHLRLVSP